MQDVNTFRETDSSVMGRTFEGSLVLPFLWINIVHVLFYWVDTVPYSQISIKSARYGHCLKRLIESRSRGQGVPDDFVVRIILVWGQTVYLD